jgi:AraC family transcriptional regulator
MMSPSPVTLHLKNVICPRCIRIIEQQLARLGLPVTAVRLGEADLARPLAPQERERLLAVLAGYGYELLEDKKAILVNQIKTALIGLIIHQQDTISTNYSTYLSAITGRDYGFLSRIFSSLEHCTIEKYIILLRIEYIKACLDDEELSLGEVAARLQYSSLGHLSRQFKMVTGYTVSEYKQLPVRTRIPLDRLLDGNYTNLIKDYIKQGEQGKGKKET